MSLFTVPMYFMDGVFRKTSLPYFDNCPVCIGNSMICSDMWHKYHGWYFKIVIHNNSSWNLRQFWNITSGIYSKYHVQIMLLFVYATPQKRFVIFACRYFKLRRNTTALNQSNCRNFPCSGIKSGSACVKLEKVWSGQQTRSIKAPSWFQPLSQNQKVQME